MADNRARWSSKSCVLEQIYIAECNHQKKKKKKKMQYTRRKEDKNQKYRGQYSRTVTIHPSLFSDDVIVRLADNCRRVNSQSTNQKTSGAIGVAPRLYN